MQKCGIKSAGSWKVRRPCLGGVLDLLAAAVGVLQCVGHCGRGHDDGRVVLLLQALPPDLHVQQAQEAAQNRRPLLQGEVQVQCP